VVSLKDSFNLRLIFPWGRVATGFIRVLNLAY